eukprot:CAMPEP_0196725078 /NCGR_PEP_ID=MMETSP1091-20130531/6730_1 /TAXON_ID=302021 /ORGANISM="Rhodomonas sp., Strain CCMP768" /LENGTH=275 /DNA_ID=CAMNT_0042067299 /DNA_START=103 /DNA_END=929 /DNA_ORIENTATION=+
MRRPEQSHCQLERELAVLSNQTIRDPCTLVSVRQRVRVIKNRLSAKRSREQARDYVEQLERNVANLATESTQLARRLARVEEENRKLRTASGLTADADVDSEATAPVDKEEKELNVREPAVLLQPSLQLDALLLFLNTLASHVSSAPLPAFASSTLAPAARAATLALALRWHVSPGELPPLAPTAATEQTLRPHAWPWTDEFPLSPADAETAAGGAMGPRSADDPPRGENGWGLAHAPRGDAEAGADVWQLQVESNPERALMHDFPHVVEAEWLI